MPEARGEAIAARWRSCRLRSAPIAEGTPGHGAVLDNATYLTWATLLTGNHTRGLDRSAGAALQWTRLGTVTAAVSLAAEQPDEARRVLNDGGRRGGRRTGSKGYRAPLLRLEAEALLAGGEARPAWQQASEALAVARELYTRPETAHCHATLAGIAVHLGDSTAAETHRAEAQQAFEQIGVTFWSPR